MIRKLFIYALIFVLFISLSACAPQATITEEMGSTAQATEMSSQPANHSNPNIILATTTSTQDSGLLDVLIPLFEQQTGYTVQVVAVGSGQALKMGEEGNADVLLVHAPASEQIFMDNGYGKDRYLVMHNDFVIVGSPQDPAGISDCTTAEEAFQLISNSGAAFVSRGDDSGTHKAELNIWKNAGIENPSGTWYIETGQGMGATLQIASEKGAYTLTDRATYLANQSTLDLVILNEGSPSLLNIYHVITVNPERFSAVNAEGAQAFASFLVSPDVQEIIGQFGMDTYGQPLFTPDAGKSEADLQ